MRVRRKNKPENRQKRVDGSPPPLVLVRPSGVVEAKRFQNPEYLTSRRHTNAQVEIVSTILIGKKTSAR